MMTPAPTFRPGDRLPDFALAGLDGKLRKFIWSFTGHPLALVVVDDLRGLDVAQYAALKSACRQASTSLVVVCANLVAAAGPAWSKIDSADDAPLLLCDGERKVLPMLLAQGGVALGQTAGLRHRVILLDPNQRIATPFDARPLLA